MKKLFVPLLVLIVIIPRLSAQNFTKGFPFYLPPFDSISQEFLPHFPKNTITEFISVSPTGDFVSGDEIIRFWGGNLTTGANFPEYDDAPLVAARMRKMGVNIVRLHHLDNPWTSSNGSIFLQNGHTTSLNPTTMDRLHFFLDQLKQEGIYANLNLHVSRQFTEGDGVLYADSIQDFGKAVTFFDGQLIDLQKQYAQQLLASINPYTGLSLVDDPVIAMVEITNENTLYGFWKDDYLQPFSKGGNILRRHADTLDVKWHQFLMNKYGTQKNIEEAWKTKTASAQEIVVDGGFESGDINKNWNLDLIETARATMKASTFAPHSGKYCAEITISQITDTDWHIQFQQNGGSVVKDSIYTVRFWAKADHPREMNAFCMLNASPWTWYGGAINQITTQWREYEFSFVAEEDVDELLRLSFSLGQADGTVWIDNVQMSLSQQIGLEGGEHLQEGNIKRIRYSKRFSYSQQRINDLAEFYLLLQKDYYDEMHDYLVNDLGVRVPITGSNAFGGPYEPYTHQNLDYIDDHAYWQHPVFPNEPWSPWDWYIENESMLAHDYLGVIPLIFGGYAIQNKPHTISEYNHPFPNAYQVEMLPILCGYGSFHGADGLMFFDYNEGDPPDWVTDIQDSYFSLHRNTPIMALFPLFSYAFRHKYIQEDAHPVLIEYSKDFMNKLHVDDNLYRWEPFFPYDEKASLNRSIRIAGFDFDTTKIPTLSRGNAPYVTSTGELFFDPQNQVFKIQTDKFECIAGQLENAGQNHDGLMEIVSGEGHGVIAWLSLNDKALSISEKSVLGIASRIQNKNMIWDGTNTVHDNWGQAPTEVQALDVHLSLQMIADSLRVYPLDATGKKMDSLMVYPESSGKFKFHIDQNEFQTLWFGIESFRTSTPISSVKKGSGIRLSPSPVSGMLNVRGNFNKCEVRIVNSLGQIVGEYKHKNHPVMIDVSEYKSGLYTAFVTTTDEDNQEITSVRKFIKQ